MKCKRVCHEFLQFPKEIFIVKLQQWRSQGGGRGSEYSAP